MGFKGVKRGHCGSATCLSPIDTKLLYSDLCLKTRGRLYPKGSKFHQWARPSPTPGHFKNSMTVIKNDESSKELILVFRILESKAGPGLQVMGKKLSLPQSLL